MSTSKPHKANPAKGETTKAKTKTADKARPSVHHAPRRHRPVLAAFVVVISLIVFAFVMIKIIDASRVDDYDGCKRSEGSYLLETNPPMCLMQDGRSFSWQP